MQMRWREGAGGAALIHVSDLTPRRGPPSSRVATAVTPTGVDNFLAHWSCDPWAYRQGSRKPSGSFPRWRCGVRRGWQHRRTFHQVVTERPTWVKGHPGGKTRRRKSFDIWTQTPHPPPSLGPQRSSVFLLLAH